VRGGREEGLGERGLRVGNGIMGRNSADGRGDGTYLEMM